MNIAELERDYQERRTEALNLQHRSMRQAETEGRAVTPTEFRTIEAKLSEVRQLKARLDQAKGDSAMTQAIEQLTAGMGPSTTMPGGASLGAQLLDSEMGQWLRANRGRFPTGAWTSPSSELMATALTSAPASGGSLIVTDHQAGILAYPTGPLAIADLLGSGSTDSNAVGYMRETAGSVNAAAPTAEGTPKPESTLVFEAATDGVRKIATWLPIVEELLEDVPALKSFIDARLRLFVQLAEDDQLLNGNGTPPNHSGILNRAGLAAPIARTTETNPDVILKQISAVETANQLPVDGVVLHPLQWQAMLLLKDADGNYIAGGGPFAAPQRKTLWGRDAVVTTAIAAGTALVGPFTAGAIYFRRGGMRVESSNSHADFYVRNMLAVRAETRGALAVVRPGAFGLVTNLN